MSDWNDWENFKGMAYCIIANFICFYLYLFSTRTLNNNDFTTIIIYCTFLFYFISLPADLLYTPNNPNARLTCLPHLTHRPFHCLFLYSLDLSYLWPQFLFDKWGYDNPFIHQNPNTHSNGWLDMLRRGSEYLILNFYVLLILKFFKQYWYADIRYADINIGASLTIIMSNWSCC